MTYSNEHKHQLLGVPDSSLLQFGAVSEPVVSAMAIGALNLVAADIAVAVSGVAGPDGGSADKPVGTVWFAWATKAAVYTRQLHFEGDREAVRQQAVTAALQGLFEYIKSTV